MKNIDAKHYVAEQCFSQNFTTIVASKKIFESKKNSPAGYHSLLKAAARRVGIITELQDNALLFKKDEVIIGGFKGMMPHTTSWLGYRVCKSKAETRKVLTDNQIPVPLGKDFSIDEVDAARNWVTKNFDRYVIKPSGLEGGIGVQANQSVSEFDTAWTACCESFGEIKDKERSFSFKKKSPSFKKIG